MSTEIAITLAVTALTIAALAVELASADVVFMAAITVLLLAGVITPIEAAGAFGNEAVIVIAVLFVIGEGVRRTGVLVYVADLVLGATARREPLFRLMLPAAAMSAFLNNTLIVAMLTPAVLDWCKRKNMAPSRMLMPLSFATILGGVCTLIGTSTNLVVDGLMLKTDMQRLGMFELTWIGVPVAVAGVAFIWVAGRALLPDRRDPVTQLGEEKREFLVELLVEAGSRLDGRSVGEAGLRNLPGLFMVNRQRDGDFLGAPAPADILRGGDRLVFAGVAASVIELRRIPGLSPAPEAHYDPLAAGRRDHLFETVVSASSPLVGTTIKDIGFRSRYDAAVIAVHRAGRRLDLKLGEVELRAGDTLMLEADRGFADRWGNSGDFALVARASAEPAPKLNRAPHVVILVVGLVATVAAGWLSVLTAAFAAIGLMLLLRILTPAEARRSIRLSVLITIAAALALGQALESSGTAALLARWLIDLAGAASPRMLLLIATTLTVAITGLVTNVAAAALIFPIVVDAAQLAGYAPRPFAIAVAIGASASFLTPFGYQTNLMVYGPGGYKFSDFPRLGVPLTVIVIAVVVVTIPAVWPLMP